MANMSSEVKMSLKIYVDVKAHKVVFAEAGKDFVDFIIHLLHLPLLSVTKLLKDKDDGMVGCFGELYKSIESLDTQFYDQNITKDLLLTPKTAAVVPLLSYNDFPTKISFYKCPSNCKYASDYPSLYCPNPNSSHYPRQISLLENFSYVAPKTLDSSRAVNYVKGPLPYIVTDTLEVKPMSISVIRSLTWDFDSLEEKHFEFGHHEGLALLKASLEKRAVLTSVFLGKKI